MRAVWSFWTKPFRSHPHRSLTSEKQVRLLWILSVETARKHFTETMLVTDDAGAQLLAGDLGLRFDHVSTALNALRARDPEWWALGKMYAYRAQDVPFVHIDHDAFLWKALPDDVTAAGVFTQSPEPVGAENPWYHPGAFDAVIDATGGWLPDEWRWYGGRPGPKLALCCGILGGTHLPFIRHYADNAIRMIEHPANQRAWRRLENKIGHNILFEQYYLAAALAFHAGTPASPFAGVTARCLFETQAEAFDETTAVRLGYTHLIGDAKRNSFVMDKVEDRVRDQHPAHYERCLRTLPGLGGLVERMLGRGRVSAG